MEPPIFVRRIQQYTPWFKAAKEILEALKEARDGGSVSKALAGLSIFGTALNTLFPGDSPWQILRQRGLRNTDYSIGGFLCELLLRSELPMTVLPVGLTSQIILWETESGGHPGVAAVYHSGEYGEGPYIQNGDEEGFIELLQDIVWTNGSDLMISTVSSGNRWFWRGAGKFRLNRMPEPGPYISTKQPQDYVDRIFKYGNVPRTVLLRGPTGIGKSVLARHIARQSGKGSTRTLKIAANTLKACRFDEVLAFVRFLQPSVLLLDDLQLDDKKHTEDFLTMLEALRAPDCLVIATMMAPTDRTKKPQMGDWHFEGMRPGRIDETFTFYLPDAKDRDLVLRHYYKLFGVADPKPQTQKAIVRATRNLSGAYLAEVARRLQVHGVESWREEIQNVCLTAPNPEKDKEEEEKKKEGKGVVDEASSS
jgi:hypothetical protein